MSHPYYCPAGRQSNSTCPLNCHPPHEAPECCSPECPCDDGEGHCHLDGDCGYGLVCGKDNCHEAAGDCCQSISMTTPAPPSNKPYPYTNCTRCGVVGLGVGSNRIIGGSEVTPVGASHCSFIQLYVYHYIYHVSSPD